MLLAELTDGGTFHQQSQHFMKMWVCGSGGVSRLNWHWQGTLWAAADLDNLVPYQAAAALAWCQAGACQ